ncbi:holliday junction resolvase [Mycobacterium phage Phrann]|uniref:Holliday junction resolvase n=8 Tax=Charlievirus TaxID=1623280 RepID=A0A1I9SCA5_9CAUD|nr:RusA-like Holliday junction resolvase [Mycobacterium phage Redi]YP_009304243.1 RusA-like Holliday junction resolvase [Mycobacterium phage Phrann]YP_010051849.1 RusA-like Holliday junction resolvase [Mycobacterium phage Raymond7]AOZ64482.1 holliday junction resolvase [Mycobacterium phage PhancyPhin]QAY16037.1 holliday junction resolvase [Mycobacterium phage BabeRuth]QBI99182.1 holliday junction resolvase [Mycobacterium phage Nenae]QBI99252.1 holliday junction resolvase [Mycobacterium phage 
MTRTRTRRSAKAAGAWFERTIADYLAAALEDDRIDKRAKTGARDKGDILGVRAHGQRVVIECKNTARLALPEWTNEAHTEANNDDALVGVVIHKRHGVAAPGRQWVAMTVDDLLALISGSRHGHRTEVTE